MASKHTLSLRGDTFEAIGSYLFSDNSVERAGYLFCRISRTDDETRMIARDFVAVSPGEVVAASTTGMTIASRSYIRAMQRADQNGEAILFVHSHPKGVARFSERDDEQEAPFFEAVYRRVHHDLVHGSIVFADQTTATGRVYYLDGRVAPIDRIRVIGQRFRFFEGTAQAALLPQFFDRQILAFGKATQELLSSLHVGIVGYGGTGSSIGEQLIRLGVGSLTVIDDDVVTETNPARLYGSGTFDRGAKKVGIARRSAERIGFGTRVNAIDGSIAREEICARLRDCDIVFGCTDDQLGRSILTRLALFYYIPVFDVAVSIESEDGHVGGVFGRVTTLVPGAACLFCRKRVRPERIAAESLLLVNPEEYRKRRGERYAEELKEDDPSIIFLTTAISASAVGEFFQRLTGAIGDERTGTELLHLFSDSKLLSTATAPDPDCLCGDMVRWGMGDTAPLLGITWPT